MARECNLLQYYQTLYSVGVWTMVQQQAERGNMVKGFTYTEHYP